MAEATKTIFHMARHDGHPLCDAKGVSRADCLGIVDEVSCPGCRDKLIEAQLLPPEPKLEVYLGRSYEDNHGRIWTIVDWSDSHGLCWLGALIRERSKSRVSNPSFCWFEPDGDETHEKDQEIGTWFVKEVTRKCYHPEPQSRT